MAWCGGARLDELGSLENWKTLKGLLFRQGP